MTESASEFKHDPRKLSKAYFTLAKRWWGAALLCKLILIAVGALAVWFSVLSRLTPFVVFILTIVSECLVWRSDKLKGTAEELLRKLDFRDSLGWEISKVELSDVLARTPARLRARITAEDLRGSYFASGDELGPRRAVQNIQESAWWSKHLSEAMGRYLFIFTVASSVGSLFILLVSVGTVKSFDVLSGIGRVVTAVLMLILSLGSIRLTLGYYDFSRKAQRVEERAAELLRYGSNEIEVVKLYNEYHLGRAVAPLIPDRIWKWNEKHLNELWKDYRIE
jgi:hypothetical protein